MLRELSIENLALFERANVEFGPGLNVVTGETGAGKSLLIDALELLLGERARVAVVRKGADEARVEGRFVLPSGALATAELAGYFAEAFPALVEEWSKLERSDARELILTRTVDVEGRSRAWVNQRPVTQRALKDLAGHLVEIHGQNEHQRLLDPAEQRRLIDVFGENEAQLERYRDKRARWLELANQLVSFEQRARERRDRLDLLRFQVRELLDAKLSVEEQQELGSERERLRHADELARELGAAAGRIAGDEGSALELVRQSERALARWEARVKELALPAEALRGALVQLAEASSALEDFLGEVEANPQRLEAVEERLFELESLEKKYRLGLAALIERRDGLARELQVLEADDGSLERLTQAVAVARAELETAAKELSKRRKALLPRLKKEVQASLAELGLERASFEVRLAPRASADLSSPNVDGAKSEVLSEQRRFGPDGADAVEFLLAANPGEGGEPLRKVASGGETARIMLALRTALAVRQTIPTLVFDEVDAGVGGRLGPKVGEHLRALSERHQILCVTHLPAIAALAERHLKVEKRVSGGRTKTEVQKLGGDTRVEEIADMIAGGAAHATARAEAKRLLGLR